MRFAAGAFTAFMLAGSSALAQVAPAGDADDIVVTARRTAERAQDVPIALTAITGEELRRLRVDDITELARFVPNLNLLSNTGVSPSASAFAFIRGVGQTESFVQNDPGVGVYVDGVYVGRTQGSVFRALDLARVEVLRGPQGTLYGRNTIGGAINLVSLKPDDRFDAYASVDAGAEGTVVARGRVAGPLGGGLSASVAGGYFRHDGYSRFRRAAACPACVGGDLTNDDTAAARVALRYAAGDFTLDVAGDYTRQRNLAIGRRLSFYNPAAEFGPVRGYANAIARAYGLGSVQAFVNDRPNTNSASIPGRDDQDVYGVSAVAELGLGETTLRSITGYRGLDNKAAGDSDGTPITLNTALAENTGQWQVSEELQALGKGFDDRLDWIAGVFVYRERATQDTTQAANFAEAPGVSFGPRGPIFTDSRNNLTGAPGPDGVRDCFTPANPLLSCGTSNLFNSIGVFNVAGFANASFAITPTLRLSAGVRYSYEEKDFISRSRPAIDPVSGAPLSPPFPPVDTKDHWDSFTPRASIDWRPAKDVLVYASYSRGFKSGTFNNGSTGPLAVDPEEVDAYEIGLKSDLFDRRLRFNLAGYFSEYKRQQLQETVPPFDFTFFNVGESQIKGLELEIEAKPVRTFGVFANIGYTEARITRNTFSALPIDVRPGATLPRIPDWTVNLGTTFEVPVGAVGAVAGRVDYNYVGPQEGNIGNSPGLQTPSRQLVGARLAFQPTGARYEVALWAKNLFDERYVTARISTFPDLFVITVDGAPRTWGASAYVRF